MVDLTYQASVQPEPLPGRAIPRLPDEANPQAYGGGVGRSIEGAADVLQQVQDKQAQTARVSQVTDAHNQLQTVSLGLTHDPNTGAFAKQGKDAFGLPQQYLPKFDEAVSQIGEGVTDPRAKQAFAQTAAQMRNQLSEQLDTHELTQHQQFATSAATAGIKLAQSAMAANYNHPDILDTNRDAMDFNIEQLAKQHGLPLDSPQVQELRQQKHLEAYQGVLTNMIADHKTALAKTFLGSLPDGEISPSERQRATLAIQKGQVDDTANGIVGSFRTDGPTVGGKALKAIDSADMPQDVKNEVYASVERGLNQWHAEQRNVHGDAIAGLEERLGSNKTLPGDRDLVWGLYHNGAFGAAQAGETIGRIEKAQEKQVDADTYQKYITDAYTKGQALDPENKDVKNGVANLFGISTAGVPPGSSEWINRGADIAQKTGVTPQPIIDWARTNLVGGDPPVAARAALAIARQQEANPRGLGFALDDRTKALAKIVNDATLAGTGVTAAVENARKIQDMPDADRQRLDELYDKKQKNNGPGALRSLVNGDERFKPGFFEGSKTIPPQMTGQFEELRRDYFKLTSGNVDQANQLAFSDLKNTWGVSQVNGKKEIMQFAPEAMNPGLTSAAVRSDLEESAKGHTPDPTKVRLIATPDTHESQGQRWGLGVPDKFGAYSVLTDEKGRVIPYQLPTATATVLAQQKKAAADGMARLHVQQAAARDSEKDQWAAIDEGARIGSL